MQRSFYTQKLLHTDALHKDAFAQRSLYAQTPYTDAFTRRNFHTETFAKNNFYTKKFSLSPKNTGKQVFEFVFFRFLSFPFQII